MHEFDLIPKEYRERCVKRTLTRRFVTGFCLLTALSVVSLTVVQTRIESVEAQATGLRTQQALSTHQQQRMTDLAMRKETLIGQSLMLHSLGAGASVSELILTIEQALRDTQVWFSSWQFRRGGMIAENERETHTPSYFIQAKAPHEFPRRWQSLTHMAIQGDAADHVALSSFVQALFSQPGIDDVRVQRSAQHERGIRFDLAVMVKSEVAP